MNWKYILIIVILAAIVGGGTLAYQYWYLPKETTKISETKPPEKITILSPTKEETWNIGKIYQIRWTPSDPVKTVGIMLIDTRIPTASLSKVWQKENIPDTGSYSFSVPSVSQGDAYQIYISTKERYGYSGLFSISTAEDLEIEILSPKGGEIWNKGNTYEIKWKPPKDTEVVSISFVNKVVRAFYGKITEKHPNTGTFEWTIPQDLLLPQSYGYIIEVAGCHYNEQLKNTVCGGGGDPRGRSEVFSITEK